MNKIDVFTKGIATYILVIQVYRLLHNIGHFTYLKIESNSLLVAYLILTVVVLFSIWLFRTISRFFLPREGNKPLLTLYGLLIAITLIDYFAISKIGEQLAYLSEGNNLNKLLDYTTAESWSFIVLSSVMVLLTKPILK